MLSSPAQGGGYEQLPIIIVCCFPLSRTPSYPHHLITHHTYTHHFNRYITITEGELGCILQKHWGKKDKKEGEEETKRKEEEEKSGKNMRMGQQGENKDKNKERQDTHTEDKEKEGEEDQGAEPEKKFDSKIKAKPKKATFREMQEKKMKERAVKEKVKEAAKGMWIWEYVNMYWWCCMFGWPNLCCVVVMFRQYWCIRKPWCSSITLYRNK